MTPSNLNIISRSGKCGDAIFYHKGPSMSTESMARNVDAESKTSRKVGEACLEPIVCSSEPNGLH